jgi:hypothetical protein
MPFHLHKIKYSMFYIWFLSKNTSCIKNEKKYYDDEKNEKNKEDEKKIAITSK